MWTAFHIHLINYWYNKIITKCVSITRKNLVSFIHSTISHVSAEGLTATLYKACWNVSLQSRHVACLYSPHLSILDCSTPTTCTPLTNFKQLELTKTQFNHKMLDLKRHWMIYSGQCYPHIYVFVFLIYFQSKILQSTWCWMVVPADSRQVKSYLITNIWAPVTMIKLLKTCNILQDCSWCWYDFIRM